MEKLASICARSNRFFFSKSRYHNLGLIRMSLSLYILYHYSGSPLRRFTTVSIVADLHTPPSLIDWLHLPYPLPEDLMQIFSYSFCIVAICSAIGLLTRPAIAFLGLHLLYLMGTQAAMGWFDHEAAISTQVLFILVIVPGTTSFSADRVIYWLLKRQKTTFSDVLLGSPVPLWGVRLLLILMCLVYFTSGFSKIRFSEGRWFNGSTLAFYLRGEASIYKDHDIQRFFGDSRVLEDKQWKDGFGLEAHHYMNAQANPDRTALAKWIANTTWLVSLLSILTVLFELSSPMLLFDGWPRTLYLAGAICMHLSIGYLMNIGFREFQIVDFFLINWYLLLTYVSKHFMRIKHSML